MAGSYIELRDKERCEAGTNANSNGSSEPVKLPGSPESDPPETPIQGDNPFGLP